MANNTANNGLTATTTASTLTLVSGIKKFATLWVRPRASQSGVLLVSVAGLHDSGDFVALESGVGLSFRVGAEGLTTAAIKSSTGSITYDWCVQVGAEAQ